MPDPGKVSQVNPHYSSDIRSEPAAPTASDRPDMYVVLGDQRAHVEVRVEKEYSLVAACEASAD